MELLRIKRQIHCKAVEQRATLIHRQYNRDWGTSYSRPPIDPYLTSPLLQNPGGTTEKQQKLVAVHSEIILTGGRNENGIIQRLLRINVNVVDVVVVVMRAEQVVITEHLIANWQLVTCYTLPERVDVAFFQPLSQQASTRYTPVLPQSPYQSTADTTQY